MCASHYYVDSRLRGNYGYIVENNVAGETLPPPPGHTPRTQCVGRFGLVRAPFDSRKGRVG